MPASYYWDYSSTSRTSAVSIHLQSGSPSSSGLYWSMMVRIKVTWLIWRLTLLILLVNNRFFNHLLRTHLCCGFLGQLIATPVFLKDCNTYRISPFACFRRWTAYLFILRKCISFPLAAIQKLRQFGTVIFMWGSCQRLFNLDSFHLYSLLTPGINV